MLYPANIERNHGLSQSCSRCGAPPTRGVIRRHCQRWRCEKITLANGTAERRASQIMLKAKAREAGCRITVGEDEAFDTADRVAHLRAINVTPHVTQNDCITATGKRRRSAIDGRTTRQEGYGMSQSCRAMIECIFGWGKQHGMMRKSVRSQHPDRPKSQGKKTSNEPISRFFRWGNRPASLWIAEDFGCCASG